jgi:LuxR family maltose regulon positive regulatory protein
METTLLRTKLYIPEIRADPSTGLPLRSGQVLCQTSIVPRPRLIERLNAGLHHKLILISAPAGFGKTTLLSSWINQLAGGPFGYIQDRQGSPSATLRTGRGAREKNISSAPRTPAQVAWISLDESDNDPVRFLTYLVAALQTITAKIGEGVLGLLQSPQPPALESILIALINEIVEIPDEFALVLDDYHLIEAQSIDQALTFLLDHLPPQMHLVIASRTDPSLPLSRWRGRNQMAEIRENDLRFTRDEVATFLEEVMGLNLSAENVAALETRTEGWIAGLQLAALSMLERDEEGMVDFINSFTGSNRYIIDYLADEVLEQRPKGTRAFLLRTSILDHLSASLCDAVLGRGALRLRSGQAGERGSTGEFSSAPLPSCPPAPRRSASSQDILESLEAANLFIVPLDDERRWYRYHHLFADLLQQRLSREEPACIPGLHRRASEWYEQRARSSCQTNGESRFLEEAVKHALAAQDFERAAGLIEELAEVLWRILRWLELVPAEYLSSRPNLCTFYAWVLFLHGQNEAAERRLQAAEQWLDLAVAGSIDASLDDPGSLNKVEKREQQGRVAAIRASIAFRQGDGPGIFKFSQQGQAFSNSHSRHLNVCLRTA